MKLILTALFIFGSILGECQVTCNKYTRFISDSRQRKISSLKKQLAQGININYQDAEGNTALHYAAWEGDVKTVEFLINNGAQIDIQNDFGQTPLMFAVWGVKYCAAKLLLDYGADINLQDCCGDTALMIPAYYDRPRPAVKMAEILLNKKYKPNLKIQNKDGNSALTVAVHYNKFYLTKTILKYAQSKLSCKEFDYILNQKNNDFQSALMISVEDFNNDLSFMLLDYGADIETVNKYVNTPIMIAILRHNTVLTDRLICMEANLNHQNMCGFTPLMFAITNGRDKLVVKLIDNGADITIKNKKGQTAADVAIATKYRELAVVIKDYYDNTDCCSGHIDFDSLHTKQNPIIIL